jgi:hypothetical protein
MHLPYNKTPIIFTQLKEDCRLVEWMVGRLVGWLVGWVVARLDGWLVGWMVGWLDD